MYVSVPCVCSACLGQKHKLNPLRMYLQEIVCWEWNAGLLEEQPVLPLSCLQPQLSHYSNAMHQALPFLVQLVTGGIGYAMTIVGSLIIVSAIF